MHNFMDALMLLDRPPEENFLLLLTSVPGLPAIG